MLSGRGVLSKATDIDYLINLGVRLSNFCHFSSHYALIPYPTFSLSLVTSTQYIYFILFTVKLWNIHKINIFHHYFSKFKILFYHSKFTKLNFYLSKFTFLGLYSKPYDNWFFKTFHPIRFFHTIRLSIWWQMSTKYCNAISYVY